MKLNEILRQQASSILERWLSDIYATYDPTTAVFLKDKKDAFANPVGHSLRKGTQAILEGLIDGTQKDLIQTGLDDIIKKRAVQEMSPTHAVSFVFILKKTIRKELGPKAEMSDISSDLVLLENRIDDIALLAFETYVRCREKVCELRVNEVKRNVSALMEMYRKHGFMPSMDLESVDAK